MELTFCENNFFQEFLIELSTIHGSSCPNYSKNRQDFVINVQYRQSESDGESHQTSFTMDPMEFFQVT